jgi:3-oxoacyl-[acyl-carrier protein] reductase
MFELTEKRALVTGASGAIGGAIARGLHRQGAIVALSGTRQTVLAELAAALGERAHVVAADLGDAAATSDLPARAAEATGGLDILVNNAGVTGDGLAVRMKDEDWQRVIDVNLTSAFRLSRAALKMMMRQRWGRIISITSIVGLTGNAGQASYAASKAGLTAMTKSLAQEVATRGITANCVAPGFIETPMTDALSEDQRAKLAAAIPVGRFGIGEDVAACVAFLASDEAAYVTGETVHVNGGMAMF